MVASLLQGISDGICIAGLRFYETVGSRQTFSESRTIKQTNARVLEYQSKEGTRPMVSNKETLYEDPGILKYTKNLSRSEAMDIKSRAAAGFFIACHAFAYLSGKEGKHSSSWLQERKMCANMISKHLVGMEIYPECSTDLGPSDYFIDAKDKSRPILTKNIINAAFDRFPVEGINKKFTDDDVDVMDIEEQIKKASEMENDEKPEGDKDEMIIIDVGPDDIREVDDETGKPEPDKTKNETDDGSKRPIFDYSKMNLAPETDPKAVTPTQAKAISDLFDEFVQGRSYQLNRFPTGAIEMVVNNGNDIAQYWIDPGLCIGNGYNVIARIRIPGKEDQYDTIMVHESERDILSKVFNNRSYLLTPDEVQKCMRHMFANQNIYHWIDMSNMQKRLEKLSTDEFRKLGKKFTFIINAVDQNHKGRMRVSAWKSIEKFTLVSDSKVKIPFPGVCNDKLSGVTVDVEGDNVTISYVDQPSSTTVAIEDYGVL